MARRFLGSVFVLLSLMRPPASRAIDATTAGEFITEPSTLISLGVEWRIEGDDNRNANVAVFYRKKGEQGSGGGSCLRP